MFIRESIHLEGKEISLETGRLAKQAAGSVVVSCGDTRVLVTVCVQKNDRELDYFPLRVDYEERFYASGKIPGGFFKREGRPSDVAVLTARLIDRPIRPLFPDGYSEEVQIVATVLSAESGSAPSVISALGASAALMISGLPFQGPIASVKVGRDEDGRFLINPDTDLLDGNGVDITVAGTKNTVTMVEGMMDELSEDEVVQAIDEAHAAIRELIALQERLVARVQPTPRPYEVGAVDASLREQVGAVALPELPSLCEAKSKMERAQLKDDLRDRIVSALIPETIAPDEQKALEKSIKSIFDDHYKAFMRQRILERNERIDGRRPDEIRPISCEVGVLPRAHGSALFTRGETQSLGIVTLGATRNDEQIIDQMMKEGRKRFMLHYNFPPFSVGEVRRIGSPSRRSIGHGYLAENSLQSVLPSDEEFPYVTRIVSEILESNGSSSMATVCSASLSMMDAGVPIRKPVAGIAMGMIEDAASDRRVILTDILGDEDHYGDMDFKVVGTADGITGFQLDVKVGGVSQETLRQALQQAKRARMEILDTMIATLDAPRTEMSPFAPRLETITIPNEKIGLVIGPGGKTIRRIIEETGAEIDIEDDGTVKIAGPDAESVAAARQQIEDMTSELEVGTVLETKVTRVVDFGAFVELKNGSEGLVHVSNLAEGFVDNVRDIVKPGDEITIEVIGEDKMGRPDLKRIEPGGSPTGKSGRSRGKDRDSDRGRRSSGRNERGRGRDRNHNDREHDEPAQPQAEETPISDEPEIEIHAGDILEGVVTNTTDYGAFVELTSSVTGLVHISELSEKYVRRVTDVVHSGDPIMVEVLNVDDRGRYKLRRIDPTAGEAEGDDTGETTSDEQYDAPEESAAPHSEQTPVEQEPATPEVPEEEPTEFEDRW